VRSVSRWYTVATTTSPIFSTEQRFFKGMIFDRPLLRDEILEDPLEECLFLPLARQWDDD